MKYHKKMFDILFIILAGVIVIVLNQFGLIVKYSGFTLIPILLAYFLGQFIERRTNDKPSD